MHLPRNIKTRIIHWRTVAKREKDPFIKFFAEYLAFNALYRQIEREGLYDNRSNSRGGGRRRISDRYIVTNLLPLYLTKRKQNTEKCLTKFKEYSHLYEELKEKSLRANSNTNEITAKKLKKDPLSATLEAIYVIRNNLFHGDKDYTIERDEKLVKIGYRLVSFFNVILLIL